MKRHPYVSTTSSTTSSSSTPAATRSRTSNTPSTLADHLGDVADSLIGHFVDQARRAGASWTDIGQHMGVSKQAAQKRFVPKIPDGLDTDVEAAFTRFTPRARKAVGDAQEEARAGRHSALEPEHLVLGLLGQPDTLAALVPRRTRRRPASGSGPP